MRGLFVAAGLLAMSSLASAATSVSCTGVAHCAQALLTPGAVAPVDGGNNVTNVATFELGGVVTYSLDGLKSLRDISLWVETDDHYSIQTSVDGQSWTHLASINAAVGNVAAGMERFSSINAGPFAASYESSIDFASVNAAFVRVQGVTSCHGLCAVGGAAFLTQTAVAAAVPEPATWALMLGGVAILAARRRAPRR